MRFTKISDDIECNLFEEFEQHRDGVASVIQPFQNHYSDVILRAIQIANEARITPGTKGMDRRFALHHLPPAAHTLQDEHIAVYILQSGLHIPSHGPGDVAVLQMKSSPFSYMVLWGETGKQWLDRNFADFVVPGNNPANELKEIMQAWDNFCTQRFPSGLGRQDWEKLSGMITLSDPVPVIHRYMYPIGDPFDDPRSYNDRIKKVLEDAKFTGPSDVDAPTPFIPIQTLSL